MPGFAGELRGKQSEVAEMRADVETDIAGFDVFEKNGGKVRFRERFMRLWILSRVLKNPRLLPSGIGHEGVWVQGVRPHLASVLQ